MTGRWALLGHGLLALAIVGFVAACGGDDDDDTGAGSGGSAGSTPAGSGGSKAGSGGSTAGSGGSMAGITAEMCVANSMKETTKTTMACLVCVCGKDPKVVDAVDASGWGLIECIGEKCDGLGSDVPCITGAPPAGCMDKLAGATTAMPTSMVFPMCKTECGIGDMPKTDDGGMMMMMGGDAGL